MFSEDHDKLDSDQLIVGDNEVLVRHFSLEAGLPSTLGTRAVCVHGKSGELLNRPTHDGLSKNLVSAHQFQQAV